MSKEDKPVKELSVTVSTDTFVRLAVLTVSFIILFFAVKKSEHALLLIFISFFLALALNYPVHWIAMHLPGKLKHSRTAATTISFLIVVIILGGFIASLIPPLIKQTDHLIKVAPDLVRQYKNQDNPVGTFIRHYHLQNGFNNLSSQLSSRLGHIGGTALTTAKSVAESFFSLLTILVLTFMMLIEGPKWQNVARNIVPDEHHEMFDKLTREMYLVIKGYVNGQVLLAFLAALFISPALLILHISYPAALVVVIFICALIPLVGHSIGAAIVSLVALFHSFSAALLILAYYILYMQIEAYIIQPKIQANATKMSPLLVFASLVIGLSFGGLIAGLVAIPIGGCIRVVVLEYLYSKNYIDKPFKAT